MRNQAIQMNLPFIAPYDDVTEQEFVSGETHQENIISNDPLKSTHHDTFHPDPDEEHSTTFMFDDNNVSITARPVFSSLHVLQNPSSSRPIYDSVAHHLHQNLLVKKSKLINKYNTHL